jgi:hypothetical protein
MYFQVWITQISYRSTYNYCFLFEFLCSFCCPPCALGLARQEMDESEFCVTCFIGNAIVMRWLVRSAYQIPGDEVTDCLMGTFCSCCVINQIYQTTKLYKKQIQQLVNISINKISIVILIPLKMHVVSIVSILAVVFHVPQVLSYLEVWVCHFGLDVVVQIYVSHVI